MTILTMKEIVMSKPKIHVEDYDMARAFNRADKFTAHIRCGIEFSATVIDIETYEEAVEFAAQLERDYSKRGRKALIYAIAGTYSVLCTPIVVELAKKMRENPEYANTAMLRPTS